MVLLASVLGACISDGPLVLDSVQSVSVVVNSTVEIGLNGRNTHGLDVEANRAAAQRIASEIERLLELASLRVADDYVTVGVPWRPHFILAPSGKGLRSPVRRGISQRPVEFGPHVSDELENSQINTLREIVDRGAVSAPLRFASGKLRELGFTGDLILIVQLDGYFLSSNDRDENRARIAANCVIILGALVAAASGSDIEGDTIALEKDGIIVRVQCYDAATGGILRYERFEACCEHGDALVKGCAEIVSEWFPEREDEALSGRS